jgi:hypothetical protein
MGGDKCLFLLTFGHSGYSLNTAFTGVCAKLRYQGPQTQTAALLLDRLLTQQSGIRFSVLTGFIL